MSDPRIGEWFPYEGVLSEKGSSRLWVLQAEIDLFVNGVVGSCTTKFLVKWVLYVGGFLNIDPACNGMSFRFLMPVRKCMC